MRNKIKYLGILGIVGQIVMAQEVGMGYGVTEKMFKNDKHEYFLPIIDMEYQNFYLKGGTTYTLAFGYNFLKEKNYNLSVYGVPFGGYDIDNADMDFGYESINDRKTMFMGGVEFNYYWREKIFTVSGEMGEEGGNINLRLSKVYRLTDKFKMATTLTYSYYNSNIIDYYFGIEQDELNTTKLKEEYNPHSAHRYGVGILGDYIINEQISLIVFGGITKFSTEIKNSPIVKDDLIVGGGTGIIYKF